MARSAQRSPTTGLSLGLIITIAAVIAYSWYITLQISRLRELQNNLVEHNRRDSLQLLRVQNDLNSLGLAMRDMLDNDEPYPLTAWSAQFQRIRTDLDSALQAEEQLTIARRTPEQTQYLKDSLAQFWDAADRTFALAQAGKDAEARAIRFACPCKPANPRSAPPSPACWCRTTKANSKPPRKSRRFTIACSARSIYFSPPRSQRSC